ncbi:MAG: hypothetical protein ACW981_17515 [Candidatus Hodarchaeales archaeon]|jgi:hypothetical protein
MNYVDLFFFFLIIIISKNIVTTNAEYSSFDQTDIDWTYFSTYGESIKLLDSNDYYNVSLTINVTNGGPVEVYWRHSDYGADLLIYENRTRTVDMCYRDEFWDADYWERTKSYCENKYHSILAHKLEFSVYQNYSDEIDDFAEGYYKMVINGGPYINIEWNSIYTLIAIFTIIVLGKKRRKIGK